MKKCIDIFVALLYTLVDTKRVSNELNDELARNELEEDQNEPFTGMKLLRI